MMHRLPASFGLLVALIALAGCSSQFADAEDAVRAKMKEPDSTEFRGLSYCGDEGHSIVRGEYNSKNIYGAYSGFESFYYDAGIADISGESGSGLIERCTDQLSRSADAINAELNIRPAQSDASNVAVVGLDVMAGIDANTGEITNDASADIGRLRAENARLKRELAEATRRAKAAGVGGAKSLP